MSGRPFPRWLGMMAIWATACGPAWGDWNVEAVPGVVYSRYAGSMYRKSLDTDGLFVSADYGNKGGLTLGTEHAHVTYKLGIPDLHEDALYVSGRLSFDASPASGSTTLRLDLHRIRNDDASHETDNVRVFAPQLSFLTRDRDLYLELGYALSRYGESAFDGSSLEVRQWTPNIGFARNGGEDWVNLRGYLIEPSNAARAQGKTTVSALEAKWTHYLPGENTIRPEQVQVGAVAGNRIYQVDPDAASVSNLADLQTGGISLGVRWRLARSSTLRLLAAHERYQERTAVGLNSYWKDYIYAGFAQRW